METPHEQPSERKGSRPAPVGPVRRETHASSLKVYKPNQGSFVRWCTAAGGGIIAVAGANFLHEQMPRLPYGDLTSVKYLVPVALLLIVAYAIFRLVGRNRRVVDFMIATEGEMKKVNWSSKKEVIGATKVVIVTVLALGAMLFIVDIFFMTVFGGIGVLKVDILGKLFGTGVES